MSGPRTSSGGCQGSFIKEPEDLVGKKTATGGCPGGRAGRAAAAHPPVINQKMMSAMIKTTSEIMRTRFIIALVYSVQRSLLVRTQDTQRFAEALARTLDFLRHFAQRIPRLAL